MRNYTLEWGYSTYTPLRKMLLMTKMTLFFMVFGLVQISANGYSQIALLSLEHTNVSINEVFEDIERNSNFRFFYDDDQIDLSKKITIDSEKELIQDVLDKILSEMGVSYEIMDNLILIKSKQRSAFNPLINFDKQRTITGKVTDEGGQPLPTVTILVKGTNNGTVTDGNGEYSISDVSSEDILSFSFIGMLTQEIPVGAKTIINVTLKIDAFGIEEVIAIGYATRKKVNLTGSVSNVNLVSLDTRAITDMSQALSGKTSGVTSMQADGLPGADGADIYIRGLNTINSTTPLVIIDGLVGSMSDVESTDVKSISILKDAASSAIYGARGANGVIIITTKRGSKGPLKVEYDNYYGIQKATTLPDMVSSSVRYMRDHNTSNRNAGKILAYSEAYIAEYEAAGDSDPIMYPNTDWVDYVRGGTGKIQKHNLSLSGGNEDMSVRLSLGYMDQTGVMPKTGAERFSFRSNFDAKVNDRLDVGINLSGKQSTRYDPNGASVTFSVAPMVVPIHPDGRYGGAQDPGVDQTYNPARQLGSQFREFETTEVTGFAFANYKISDALTASVNGGIDYSHTFRKRWETTWQQWDFVNEGVSRENVRMWLDDNSARNRHITIYSTLNYEKTIAENHNINILAGFQQEDLQSRWIQGKVFGFANNNLTLLDATINVEEHQATGSVYEWALRSYFSRFNYDYKGKYLLEANLRYDGSSRFAQDNRWGLFPSISAGWRVTEEPFMQNVRFIDYLKVRGSWGQVGNNVTMVNGRVNNYPYMSVYEFGQNYILNNSVVPGVAVAAMVDQNIKWETTEVTNFGIDMAVLDSKLHISAEYFIKTTRDILLQTDLPAFVGNLDAPTQNLGIVQNKGFDLEIGYKNRNVANDFRYGVSLVLSKVENKVLKYTNAPRLEKFLIMEDYPLYSLYGLQVEKIFQNQEEVDGAPFQNAQTGPGDFKYVDQITEDTDGDGIADATNGKIDSNDKVVLGDPFPDMSYGLSMNLGWKGFDFSAFIQGQFGSEGWLQSYLTQPFVGSGGGPYPTWWADAWTPENTDTDIPRLNGNNLNYGGGNTVVTADNSWLVRDQSYVRLRNITLGYNLPEKICHAINIDRVRLYINGDNLLLISNFPGFDPERGLRSTGTTYPVIKSCTMGIQVTF